MIGAVLIVAFVLIFALMLIYGALCRIADSIEAQNAHYGIGVTPPAEKQEAA